jgi:hypothetical protein
MSKSNILRRLTFSNLTLLRYFFSPKVLGSIDAGESRLSLAMCCIMYLCQGYHDPDISDEDVIENVLTGAYSLHDFAATMWLKLTEQLTSDSRSLPPELASLLETLIDKRANDEHDGSKDHFNSPNLDPLKESLPDLYTVLCDAASFRKLSLESGFRLSQSKYMRKVRVIV